MRASLAALRGRSVRSVPLQLLAQVRRLEAEGVKLS